VVRFRLELGPVPLHHQVYLDLRDGLDRGTWRAGQQVPTERDLANRYGCSLITVRRALDELVREQRIERTRGRGTFVLPARIDLDLAGELSFSEEMQRKGLEPATRLVSARPESASPSVASALAIAPDSPTVYLERLRMADEEPYLLEQVHLPAERFPGLLAEDLEHGSLYEILGTRYDTPVVRARETIEPVVLRGREASLLGQRPGAVALLVEGTAFASDGEAVEFGRSYVRADRSRYLIDRIVVRSRSAGGARMPIGTHVAVAAR
jgi:GntR family transcriptional regulator, N-acetylglucosamine utilization regulator